MRQSFLMFLGRKIYGKTVFHCKNVQATYIKSVPMQPGNRKSRNLQVPTWTWTLLLRVHLFFKLISLFYILRLCVRISERPGFSISHGEHSAKGAFSQKRIYWTKRLFMLYDKFVRNLSTSYPQTLSTLGRFRFSLMLKKKWFQKVRKVVVPNHRFCPSAPVKSRDYS